MTDSRLNKRIALWANDLSGRNCKNWFYIFKNKLKECDLEQYCDISQYCSKAALLDGIAAVMHDQYVKKWRACIANATGPSGRGGNKLRTYRILKSEFETEHYCKLIMPLRHRAAFSKFGCGVAHLRIETGRYEGLEIDDRKCPFCGEVEDESHVLLRCYMYDDLRRTLFDKAIDINENFSSFTEHGQLQFLFTKSDMCRICAKTCFNILQRRTFYMCR